MSVCAKLINGQNSACTTLVRRYAQSVILINKEDISSYTIKETDYSQPDPTCAYSVQFKLKPGTKGYLFRGSENGSSFFGTYDKSSSELGGLPQYKHNANMIIVGADEEAKCILSSLDKGRYVAVYKFADNSIEVYGIENGLSTADYSYDVQGGGGGSAMVLSSSESSPESKLPLIYKPQQGGDALADFDSLFAA